MKTKFKLEINARGEDLNAIIDVIARHNEGKSNIDIDTICAHLLFQKARYPETYKGLKINTEGDNGQTIHISENDGESYYLSITECEMEELQETWEEPRLIFKP